MVTLLVIGGLLGVVKSAVADHGAQGIERRPAGYLDVQVWVDRGEGSRYRVGDPIEIYFRTNRDAHVVLYDIDTEGFVRVLFPEGPRESGYVRGGRTYRVPGSRRFEYFVTGPSGIEYVEAVASIDGPRRFESFRKRYGHGSGGGNALRIEVDGVMGIERIRAQAIGRRPVGSMVASDRTYFHVLSSYRWRKPPPRCPIHFGLSGICGETCRWRIEASVGIAPGHEVKTSRRFEPVERYEHEAAKRERRGNLGAEKPRRYR